MDASKVQGDESVFDTTEGSSKFSDNTFETLLNQIKAREEVDFIGNTGSGHQILESGGSQNVADNTFVEADLTLISRSGISLKENKGTIGQAQIDAKGVSMDGDRLQAKGAVVVTADTLHVNREDISSEKSILMEGKQEFFADESKLTANDAVDISGNDAAFIQKSNVKGGSATHVEAASVYIKETTLNSPQGSVKIEADEGRVERSRLTSEKSIELENVSFVENTAASDLVDITSNNLYAKGNEFQAKQLNAEAKGSALISDNIINAASQLTVNEEAIVTGNRLEGALNVESDGNLDVIDNTFVKEDVTLVSQAEIFMQKNKGAVGQAQIAAPEVSMDGDHLHAHGPVVVSADTLHLSSENVSSEKSIVMEGKLEVSVNLSHLSSDDVVDVLGNGPISIQQSTMKGDNATNVKAPTVHIEEAALSSSQGNVNVKADQGRIEHSTLTSEQLIKVENVSLVGNKAASDQIEITSDHLYVQGNEFQAKELISKTEGSAFVSDNIINSASQLTANKEVIFTGNKIDGDLHVESGEHQHVSSNTIKEGDITLVSQSSISLQENKGVVEDVLIAAQNVSMDGDHLQAKGSVVVSADLLHLTEEYISSENSIDLEGKQKFFADQSNLASDEAVEISGKGSVSIQHSSMKGGKATNVDAAEVYIKEAELSSPQGRVNVGADQGQIENSTLTSEQLIKLENVSLIANTAASDQIEISSNNLFVKGNEFQGKQLISESEGSAIFSDNIIDAASQLTAKKEVVLTGNTIDSDLYVESDGNQHIRNNTFKEVDLTLVSQNGISLQENTGTVGQAQIAAQDVSMEGDHLQAKGPVVVSANTVHLNRENVSSEKSIAMEGKQGFSANQSTLTADDIVGISGNGSASIQNSTVKGNSATNVVAASVSIKETTLSSPEGNVNVGADQGRIERSTLTSEQLIKLENVSLVGNTAASDQIEISSDHLFVKGNEFQGEHLIAETEGSSLVSDNIINSASQWTANKDVLFTENKIDGDLHMESGENQHIVGNTFVKGDVTLNSLTDLSLQENSGAVGQTQIAGQDVSLVGDHLQAKGPVVVSANTLHLSRENISSEESIVMEGKQEFFANQSNLTADETVDISGKGSASIQHSNIKGYSETNVDVTNVSIDETTLSSPQGSVNVGAEHGRIENSTLTSEQLIKVENVSLVGNSAASNQIEISSNNLFVKGNEFQSKQLNAEAGGSVLISDNIIHAASQLTANKEVVFTGNKVEGDLHVESGGIQHVGDNTFKEGDVTFVSQSGIALLENEGAIGYGQIAAQDVSMHGDHIQAKGPVAISADTLHLARANISSEKFIAMESKQEFSAIHSNLTADDAVDISGSGSAFIQNSSLKGSSATNVGMAKAYINETTLSSPQGDVIVGADQGHIENSTLTSEKLIKVENVSLIGSTAASDQIEMSSDNLFVKGNEIQAKQFISETDGPAIITGNIINAASQLTANDKVIITENRLDGGLHVESDGNQYVADNTLVKGDVTLNSQADISLQENTGDVGQAQIAAQMSRWLEIIYMLMGRLSFQPTPCT